MKNSLLSFFFSMFLALSFCGQNTITEKKLHKNWTFKEIGTNQWFPAVVPGCIHIDLMKNGIIEDPFYRTNESKVQWVDKKDWVYQNEFKLNKEELNQQHHEIKFEGIDTYAEVYLNDSLILESNNMHRTYLVDVTTKLKEGINKLKVILFSPINKGVQLYDAIDYKIPVSANDQAETGEVTDKKRVSVFTRKAGYHYGWDWGPRLVTSGIWRAVKLVSWSDFRIKEFNVKYSLDGTAQISAATKIESSITNSNAKLTIQLNDSIVASKIVKLDKSEQQVSLSFNLKNPKLWWPNGMGQQYLYDFSAILEYKGIRNSKNQKLGIRKIGLEILDSSNSQNFQFKVNGYSTFAKGVNYIPQDVFLPRVNIKDYERLLMASAKANMNMIRVWGGGVYEDNSFYELCDSLGIMVWQDFMFACAMYPGDSSFLDNVRLEAIDNFKRINKHTSVVLWCGNNENLAAWKRWGWEQTAIKEQSSEIAEKIWNNYDTLFHQILPKVVAEYSLEQGCSNNNDWTDYWASSPSASQGIPESYKTGDTHYWGVWWGKEPFNNFNTKISSFMSEYGFQSFPEYSTFKKFANNEDEGIYSTVMKHHQRSSIGNATIEEYMSREFKNPKNFEALLYTSQLLQADGIRLGIEAHRRNKKRCMGSLYWQLNDCWPGASWSGIDYFGKWKALHYHVKKAFAPIIISHEFIDSNLHISIVSDQLVSFHGSMEVQLLTFSSDSIVAKWSKKVFLKPLEVITILKIPKKDLPFGKSKQESYISLSLNRNEEIVSTKNVFFLPFKKLQIPIPNLNFESSINDKEKQITVDITTQKFAKGVWVSSLSNENFSDNFFNLNANGHKAIHLPYQNDQDPRELIKTIKIKSLWDSFN